MTYAIAFLAGAVLSWAVRSWLNGEADVPKMHRPALSPEAQDQMNARMIGDKTPTFRN